MALSPQLLAKLKPVNPVSHSNAGQSDNSVQSIISRLQQSGKWKQTAPPPSKPILPPDSQPSPNPFQGALNKVGDVAKNALPIAKNIVSSIEKPFVDVAATPVQALAKKMGQPDPYANFQKETGLPNPNPIEKPLQKVGSAGEIASYLIPYGRFANLGTVGKIITGAMAGYGIDVSSKLAEGKNVKEATKPGLATAIGGALPAVGPAVGAVARGVGETLGVTTGTGYGVIKQAFTSGTKGLGSTQEKEFISALMGNTDPEQIVQEAKTSLGTIIADRRATYQSQLAKITNNKTSLDISPINNELQSQLGKFNIAIKDGALDFSRSAIRFDKSAQSDVQDIYETMKTFGTQKGDRTAVGVDQLKQALHDKYSPSSSVRALTTAVANSAKKVLSSIPGYNKMMEDYSTKTNLISDIQKALSLGNKSQVDTAYKKLTSALRLNNEFRKEMIGELDKATGGALSSKIAGEQMSEILPRGLMRPLEGAAAVTMGAAGFIVPLLKFAFAASPKIVGGLVNALGLTSGQAMRVFNAIGGMKTLQTAISPAIQAASNNTQQPPTIPAKAGNQSAALPALPIQ